MSSNKETIERLSHVLADTYSLYLKTQNFHWNVKGPMFHSLHVMFEEPLYMTKTGGCLKA